MGIETITVNDNSVRLWIYVRWQNPEKDEKLSEKYSDGKIIFQNSKRIFDMFNDKVQTMDGLYETLRRILDDEFQPKFEVSE